MTSKIDSIEKLEELVNLTDDWVFVGLHITGTFMLRSKKLDIPYRYYEIGGDLRMAKVLERLYDTQPFTRAELPEVMLDHLEYAYPECLSLETGGAISEFPENGMWVFGEGTDILNATTRISWLHKDKELTALRYIDQANEMFREMLMLWTQVLSNASKIDEHTYDLTPSGSYTLEFMDVSKGGVAMLSVKSVNSSGQRTCIEYRCATHTDYIFKALRLLPEIFEALKADPETSVLIETANDKYGTAKFPKLYHSAKQLNLMAEQLNITNKRLFQ